MFGTRRANTSRMLRAQRITARQRTNGEPVSSCRINGITGIIQEFQKGREKKIEWNEIKIKKKKIHRVSNSIHWKRELRPTFACSHVTSNIYPWVIHVHSIYNVTVVRPLDFPTLYIFLPHCTLHLSDFTWHSWVIGMRLRHFYRSYKRPTA